MADNQGGPSTGAPSRMDGVPGLVSLGDRLSAGMLDAAAGLLMLSDDGRVEYANRRAESMLGLGELVGWYLRDLDQNLVLPGPETRVDIVTSAFRDARDGRREIVWTRNAGGGWIGVSVTGSREAAGEPDPRHVDPLTGLGNRARFEEIGDAMLRARAESNPDTVSILLDLDHLRRANEMLDQEGANDLLRKVAQRLRQITRASDLLARIGEDEFVILISAEDGRAVAEGLAERAVDLLSRPFLIAGEQILIGVSVGLAAMSQGAKSLEELLRLAGIALAAGRKQGLGRVRWFDEGMETSIRERHAIITGLRRALLVGEFEVHYQPQVSVEAEGIDGFEALIRWRHPERGMISPMVFIPIAEDSGLIDRIGEWVLRRACADAVAWADEVSVAVNVSPIQFEARDFVAIVKNALDNSGLAPGRLELELTEAVLLVNSDETVAKMHELRALGVRLALDDFGIGYSSLNYLRQFPFDKIKIDQSFVRGPTADAAANRIVMAVASLGEAFGMSVLAEGVETAIQRDTMRDCGCGSVQGYLYSKPIPAEGVRAYLATARAAIRANREARI